MYCMTCKKKQEGVEPEVVIMKNKRRAEKAKCPVCGRVGFTILKKEASAPPAVPAVVE